MDKAPNYLHVGCVIQKKPNFRKCAPELEGFLKQIEPAKMTNDDKDKFVQEMMLDFDKADLDKDGTINFSGKDVVFYLTTQAKKGEQISSLLHFSKLFLLCSSRFHMN